MAAADLNPLTWPLEAWFNLLAAIVGWTATVIVLRAGFDRPINRRVAAVLGLESTFASLNIITNLAPWPATLGEIVYFSIIAGIGASYVALLAMLDLPTLRFFRRRAGILVLLVYPATVAVLGVALIRMSPTGDQDNNVSGPITGINLLLGALFGVVASLWAVLRSAKGSLARRQATAFLTAYGVRDSMWIGAVATNLIMWGLADAVVPPVFWGYFIPIVSLIYVPLLGYGILRSQLFDIDLKVKFTLQHSTALAILAVVFFLVSNALQAILPVHGLVASLAGAIAILVVMKPVEWAAKRLVDGLMPKVAPTATYLEERKHTVFRSALESAWTDGQVTEREQRTLDRLRHELGIDPLEAATMEEEIRRARPAMASGNEPNGTPTT